MLLYEVRRLCPSSLLHDCYLTYRNQCLYLLQPCISVSVTYTFDADLTRRQVCSYQAYALKVIVFIEITHMKSKVTEHHCDDWWTDVNVQLLICTTACSEMYLADLVFAQVCGHKLLFGGQVYPIDIRKTHWWRCTCQVNLDHVVDTSLIVIGSCMPLTYMTLM